LNVLLPCIMQSKEEAINDWLSSSIADLESKAGPAPQESTCTPNRKQAQLGKKRKIE